MGRGFFTPRMHGACIHTPPDPPEGLSVQPFVAGRRKEREKGARAGGEREGAPRKGEGRCWEWFAVRRAGRREN